MIITYSVKIVRIIVSSGASLILNPDLKPIFRLKVFDVFFCEIRLGKESPERKGAAGARDMLKTKYTNKYDEICYSHLCVVYVQKDLGNRLRKSCYLLWEKSEVIGGGYYNHP